MEIQPSLSNTRINYEIEVLRGISVILVMFTHVPVIFQWEQKHWWPFFQNNGYWFGVDIFFAISGFVVTKSVLKHFCNATPRTLPTELKSFFIRRFYRLMPIAWLVMVVTIIVSIFFNKTGIFATPAGNINDFVSFIFYSANWHAAFCSPDAGRICGMNQMYWSLSLEEQFYFVLPFALFFLRKKVVILAFALIIIQFPLERPMFKLLWLTRVDAICWGVIIGVAASTNWYSQFKPTIFRSFWMRSLLIVTTLFSLSTVATGNVLPFSVAAIAIGSAVLVWVASYQDGLLFKRAPKMKTMLWFGSRSYGLYLIHPFSFFVMLDIGIRKYGSIAAIPHSYTWPCLIGGLILSFGLTELSYRFIETPLRNKGKRIADAVRASNIEVKLDRLENA